jgi:hypothetical protein
VPEANPQQVRTSHFYDQPELVPVLDRKIADFQTYFPDIQRREFGRKWLKLAVIRRFLRSKIPEFCISL